MTDFEPAPEKAQSLLRVIVEAIDRGRIRTDRPESFLSYSEALGFLGLPKPWFRPGNRLLKAGLDDLDAWTRSHPGLPRIAALIVNKKTRRPSDGFAARHGRRPESSAWEEWWMEEANRAIRFDWNPFLVPLAPDLPGKDSVDLRVREGDESDLPDDSGIITMDPAKRGGRPCIRGMRITVGDVLDWLAEGMSVARILEEFPELTEEDIRASLAYAADRDQPLRKTTTQPSRLSVLAGKWRGELTLPESDKDDPRMDLLLRKYWRNRA